MASRIDPDVNRFNQKLKNHKTDAVKKFFRDGGFDLPAPDGGVIRIPRPILEIPRFRFGDNGGVAQGDGEVGDPIPGQGKPGKGKPGPGEGHEHGTGHGEHEHLILTPAEAAEILGEQLQLPNLREKLGGDALENVIRRYNSIRTVGPNSLRHFKRTYKQALARSIASGQYQPGQPVIPLPEDHRYKFYTEKIISRDKAVIVFVMDYSGSMSSVIDFCKQVGWWADAWIQHHYPKIVRHYVHYDSAAKEVPADEFFEVGAGGGTDMRAGLSMVKKIISKYKFEEYNAFVIHFTDGDCQGLNVTSEQVEDYRRQMEEFRKYAEENGESLEDFFDFQNEPEAGNVLTDYLLKRCNCLFVCEAGRYYGDNNYTELLKRLQEQEEELKRKIRFAGFSDKVVNKQMHKALLRTLRIWFT